MCSSFCEVDDFTSVRWYPSPCFSSTSIATKVLSAMNVASNTAGAPASSAACVAARRSARALCGRSMSTPPGYRARAASPTWRPWSNRSCRTLSGCSSMASGSCTSHQSFLWHWRPEVKRDLERRCETVLLRQSQRIDASIRVERCPDRAHHRGLAGQSCELTDPEYRLDARAMRAKQIDQPRGVEFLGRPRDRLVLPREQLQAADHAVHRARPRDLAGVLHGIHHARVPAPRHDDESLVCADDQRHVLRNRVRYEASRRDDLDRRVPVPLGVASPDGPGHPHAGQQLGRARVLDECCAERFQLLFDRDRRIRFLITTRFTAHHPTRPAGWTGQCGGAATTQEYSGSDVNAGQRGRVLFRELAPQGRETPV